MENNLIAFKAYIRVVKSLIGYNGSNFGSVTVIKEKLIYAKDKKEVKQLMLEKYPQFFQNDKVYSKETKDEAQFFYLLIYELTSYDLEDLHSGEWICSGCGKKHENKYISSPKTYSNIGNDYLFCKHIDYTHPENNYQNHEDYIKLRDQCLNLLRADISGNGLPDNMSYVRPDSLNYIYKITEKKTGKCYIGKTKNEPFFRWFEHLKHSRQPFGVYLRETKLEEWTFEVLQTIPALFDNNEILKIESDYIVKYDSINNGFNIIISNKSALLS